MNSTVDSFKRSSKTKEFNFDENFWLSDLINSIKDSVKLQIVNNLIWSWNIIVKIDLFEKFDSQIWKTP